jgi:hypothetical protein
MFSLIEGVFTTNSVKIHGIDMPMGNCTQSVISRLNSRNHKWDMSTLSKRVSLKFNKYYISIGFKIHDDEDQNQKRYRN